MNRIVKILLASSISDTIFYIVLLQLQLCVFCYVMLSLLRPRSRWLVPEGPTKVKDIRGSTKVKGVYSGHCSNLNTLAKKGFFLYWSKVSIQHFQHFPNPDLAISYFFLLFFRWRFVDNKRDPSETNICFNHLVSFILYSCLFKLNS